MTAGYITVFNQAYENLANILQRGIKLFSKYPIHLVKINQNDPARTSFWKLEALARSPFDYTVFLDADVVPTPCVDDLMELAMTARFQFPLIPRHITNFDVPNADPKSMPYGIGCVIILNHEAQNNLATGLQFIRRRFLQSGPAPPYEEPHFNAWLWHVRARQQINFCCPRSSGYLKWRRGAGESIYPGHLTTFQVFHDQKNWVMAEEILEDIQLHTAATYPKPQLFRSA